jgi:hypothetical protein
MYFCTAGRTYRPNVVRVGSELGGVGAEVRERLVRAHPAAAAAAKKKKRKRKKNRRCRCCC